MLGFGRFLLCAAILCLGGSLSQAAVWTATQTWSDAAEDQYAEWVKTHWVKEFFVEEGTPYTGMRLDCADAVLAMRIIFAYEHLLPIKIVDPTGGKTHITEQMRRWDELPEEKRIRRFLNYVFETNGTVNLPGNTYPAAVSREAIRSGSLLLSTANHHAWTVKEVSRTGVPFLIQSRRPRRTVLLTQQSFPSVSFLFKGDLTPKSHAGYRNFRWPEDIGKPAWKVPGYSEEQYALPIHEWNRALQRKLELDRETPEQELERLLSSACETAEGRALEVRLGIEYLSKKPAHSCYTQQEFDDYSTPSYDYRLRQSFKELSQSLNHSVGVQGVTLRGDLAARMDSVQNPVDSAAAGVPAYCPIEYAPGKVLSLGQIRLRSIRKQLSSNPHDPIEYRWGEKLGHSARAKACPNYQNE